MAKKMNPEVKAKWVVALRSGEYKQGQRKLRVGDAFCCLGVLCNLHAQSHPEIAARQHDTYSYMGHLSLTPIPVENWAGLDVDVDVEINGVLAPLYSHNDDGRTFAEIADAIESQL